MTNSEWLAQVQVGDEAVLDQHHHREVVTITHATATQLRVGASVFSRSTGRLRGGSSFRTSHLRAPQAGEFDRIRAMDRCRDAEYRLSKAWRDRWTASITPEELVRVTEALEAATAILQTAAAPREGG